MSEHCGRMVEMNVSVHEVTGLIPRVANEIFF